MNRRVILTDVAEVELEAAYRWYVEHAPSFAERWYNGFLEQLGERSVRISRSRTRESSESGNARGSLTTSATVSSHLPLALQALADDPERFSLAPESGDLIVPVRQMLYGLRRKTHRAVFTVRADAVVVLRIRHVAQSLLSDLE